MYLKNRQPLPINVNPQMTFLDDPNPAKNERAVRAASMIHASAAFFRTLRDEQLEPDLFETKPHLSSSPTFKKAVCMLPEQLAWFAGFAVGAYALDMSQYSRLFQSTRLPGRGSDLLESFPNSRHVVVQRGSAFFIFDIIDKQGQAVPREQIERNLRAILDQQPDTDTVPLGVLTTMERDAWADARHELVSNSLNAASLEQVDSALFALCLEDEAPTTMHDVSRCMLHGNGRNRWFDKSFQLIVTANGRCAVNFEHAWGDGVAVLRYFNEVYKESIKQPVLDAAQLPTKDTVQQLKFETSATMKDTVKQAAEQFDAARNAVELKILESRVSLPSKGGEMAAGNYSRNSAGTCRPLTGVVRGILYLSLSVVLTPFPRSSA